MVAVSPGNAVTAFDMNTWVGIAQLTADSATWGATESAASLLSVTFQEVIGQEYKITLSTNVGTDVANDCALIRVRADTVTGTQLLGPQVFMPTTSVNGFGLHMTGKYTGSVAGIKTLVITGQRNSGTGVAHRIRAAGSRPTFFAVERLNG
jgi:hypothetical protein